MNIHTEQLIQKRRFSEITSYEPDKNSYPKYYNAKRFKITLCPGDYLYIPYGWFHHIFSDDTDTNNKLNIAVNCWIKNNHHNELNVSNMNFNHVNNITILSNDYINLSDYNYSLIPFVIHKEINNYTINDIKNILNDIPLTYLYSKNKIFYSNHTDSNVKCYDCTIDNFINDKNENTYIHQSDITNLKNTDFIKHITPHYLSEASNINYNIWINHGNISSVNHYDLYDNTLIQISGKKTIYLFPPNERNNLYLMNPDKLENILLLKKNYYLSKDAIVNKAIPIIQYYKNSIDNNLCKKIIYFMNHLNTINGYIIDKNIDNYLFDVLKNYMRMYLDSLINLNYENPLNIEYSDTGYYIENRLYSNNTKIPKGAVLKYIMFLNDAESTYINDVEIPGSKGSLLIYPVYFSYKESNKQITKDKWICSGYICNS